MPDSDSRLEGIIRRLEQEAADKFLQEHRFSDVNHCRRASRWPLSRRCCPLSLAAEKGDVLMVVMLLNRGADPLLPVALPGRRQSSARGQQEASRLLEWAAAAVGETGHVPALQMSLESWSLCSVYRLAGAIGREREEPLLRGLRRDDPLLRRDAQGTRAGTSGVA